MMALLKRKPRLLLLDDDPSMQRLLSFLLRRAGYRLDVVSEASAAMKLLATNTYDALLLDIMTPTEGGMTVIRDLRESKPDLLKRVILVTGSPDSVLKNVQKDVFAIVHKPFEESELTSAIARLLKTS
jgi:two-component system response regulator GlrR